MPGRGPRHNLLMRVACRGLLPGVVAASLFTAAGCASGPPVDPAPSALAWTERTLPDRLEPVTLTVAKDLLVIGAYAAEKPRPRILTLRGDQHATVEVRPQSPYAFHGRWVGIAVQGQEVVAVAGARGGAHANYRWTVWRGSLDVGTGGGVLDEQPQPFGVFGGWGAGDLTGVQFAGHDPVVSGAWASDHTGNDVSLWRVSGERWSRQPSTGTALGSTPTELKGARSITSTGSGLVLSGSVTDLASNAVRSVPAVWRGDSADGPWTLLRLPATSSLADAHAATCDASSCLVVGQDAGALAVWRVTGSRAERVGTPGAHVPEKVALPAPVHVSGVDVVLLPGQLGVLRDGQWSTRAGPPGTPVSAQAVGATLHVVTQDATGHTHLWSAAM